MPSLTDRFEQVRQEIYDKEYTVTSTPDAVKDELMSFYLRVNPGLYIEMATLRAHRIELTVLWRLTLYDMLAFLLGKPTRHGFIYEPVEPENNASESRNSVGF